MNLATPVKSKSEIPFLRAVQKRCCFNNNDQIHHRGSQKLCQAAFNTNAIMHNHAKDPLIAFLRLVHDGIALPFGNLECLGQDMIVASIVAPKRINKPFFAVEVLGVD